MVLLSAVSQMKPMRFDLNNTSHNNNHNPFSLAHKHNQVFVKFSVCFLLLGLAYRFYFSSFPFSPIVVTHTETLVNETFPFPVAKSPESSDPLVIDEHSNKNRSRASQNEKCDIFTGDWVHDSTGPYYTNISCHSMEDHQNCMKNGRPDSGYFYWRWNPRDCKLPKFNPERFLELMRHKSMAFIGDSISRNHVQSLLCILSQEEEAVEVYHDKEYRSKKWHFPSYDFTLSVIWSPFLVKGAVFEDSNGVSTDITKLHLDILDAVWVDQYKDFDYIEIGGGKWYLKTAIYYENNTIVGCHNCHNKNITQVGFEYAYRKAINETLNFITSSKHKVYTFYRTSTPDHFENGEWNTGGYCNRTEPFREGEVELIDVDRTMRDIDLEEYEKAAAIASEKGLSLKLFDTTRLSLLRPDGHPGPYRAFHPYAGKDKNAKVQNDCLHWCLPGPIDSWNDVIMEILLNE